jgi:hypothetical protein
MSLLGGIVDWFTGYEDPAKAGKSYLEKIPGQVGPYFDPFIKRGERAGGALEGQYGKLLNDPGGMVNKFGEGYQKSPGFDFALKQALQGAGHAASAGGMAGSPAHENESMGIATQMANQDYMKWLDRVLGMYGKGLSGEENMYGKGFEGSKSMADMIAQMLAGEAGMEYGGAQQHNQFIGDILKSIIQGGSAAAGAA